jgi:integrase
MTAPLETASALATSRESASADPIPLRVCSPALAIRLQPIIQRLAIARLGKNADVKHGHPHRFRHTFTVTYLRSSALIICRSACRLDRLP